MLKPSMKELMNKVGNRYLLVNLAAQRARDIAQESEEREEPLPDKAVKLALDEIAAGTVVYWPGPKVEPEIRVPRDLPGTLDLDLDVSVASHEEAAEETEELLAEDTFSDDEEV